jgi:hypothetical protein
MPRLTVLRRRSVVVALLLAVAARGAHAQLAADTHLKWSGFAGALMVENITGVSSGGGLSARLVRENAPFDLAFDAAYYRFPPVRVKDSGIESSLDQAFAALSATLIVQRPGSPLQLLSGAGTYSFIYRYVEKDAPTRTGWDNSFGYHVGVGIRTSVHSALEARYVTASYRGYDALGADTKVTVRMLPVFLRLAF